MRVLPSEGVSSPSVSTTEDKILSLDGFTELKCEVWRWRLNEATQNKVERIEMRYNGERDRAEIFVKLRNGVVLETTPEDIGSTAFQATIAMVT